MISAITRAFIVRRHHRRRANRRPCRRCSAPCRRRTRACGPARSPAPARASPSHSAKNEASSPVEEFLDHDLGARRAERAAEHHVDGGERLIERHGDDNALAGGEAIGLDDDRRALRAHVRFRRLRIAEGVRRRAVGMSLALHRSLVKRFDASNWRRRLRRAERLDAGGRERIDDALGQRAFRTDHDEIHRCWRGRTRSQPHDRQYRVATHSAS